MAGAPTRGVVLVGHGGGRFAASTGVGSRSYPYSVAIGDLNGDGKPDLSTANYDNSTRSEERRVGKEC